MIIAGGFSRNILIAFNYILCQLILLYLFSGVKEFIHKTKPAFRHKGHCKQYLQCPHSMSKETAQTWQVILLPTMSESWFYL